MNPEELGVGTGLVLCANTFFSTLSPAIFGIVFDTTADEMVAVQRINMLAIVFPAIGLIIIVTVLRKILDRKDAQVKA